MGSAVSSLLFQPPDVTYVHAKKHIIWLRTKNNANVPAFYIDRHSSTTILFSHGNAEDLGMIYEWFCELTREVQVNLLAYDYEGYGKASGTPSEQACYEDVDAAWTFLTEVLKHKPRNIVLYGRSLGSGPSCYLAERLSRDGVKIGGLILQSPIMSVFRVAFNFRFSLPGDMFCNVDRVSRVSCPVFVIHGTRDEVVPFWNGEGLFLAVPVKLRAKPFWVDGAGHNNLETLTREDGLFFAQIIEFLVDWVPTYSFKEGGGDALSDRTGVSGNSLKLAGRMLRQGAT
jgi:fermentation-respiration switch protein FrsA (DUF1100 family)